MKVARQEKKADTKVEKERRRGKKSWPVTYMYCILQNFPPLASGNWLCPMVLSIGKT